MLDGISSATIVLQNKSAWSGAMDNTNTAKSASLTLDGSSTWEVRADSHLDALVDADASLANIRSHGHTVYYNASNSANAYLQGKTFRLAGGGTLTPEK